VTASRSPVPGPPGSLVRLYTLALASYPRRHRRRFRAELLLMLEESWRAQRCNNRTPALRFWGNAFRDVLVNALLLRAGAGSLREPHRSVHAAGRARRAEGAQRSRSSGYPHPLLSARNRSPATRIEVLLTNIVQDVKYALRTLRRAPGFAAAVVLTLALGIGANAAIFSVLDAVVLTPFPYPGAERLINVWTQYPEQGIDIFPASRAEFTDYRAESELFEAMFAYRVQNVTLTGVGRPQRIAGAAASADIWEVLGARTAHGRLYGAAEDIPGNDGVVVLDNGYWQQTFGADPAVVGRAITLDGFPFEVIGVTAPRVTLPDTEVAFYTPLAIDTSDLSDRSGHGLTVLGRTRPGAELDDVLAEMAVVSARWAEQYGHAHPFNAERLADQVIGDARRPLFLLAGAVGFVLLIACANVAGLLLARTTGRQREIGVRAALGAPRLRLARQILTEGLVLAAAGGALGGLTAAYGTRLLLRLEPGNLPRLQEIGAGGAMAAFVAAISVVAGFGFAALPAWHVARTGAGGVLAAAPRTTAGARRQGLQRLLVAGEVAAAVVLVIGAGLLIRSFVVLTRVDPGVRASNLVTTRISLPGGSYQAPDDALAFWQRLRDALEAMPAVQDTAVVLALPLRDNVFTENFLRRGDDPSIVDAGQAPSFGWQMSSPGYFRALGIPIAAGRDFTAADRAGSPRVAIVTEATVQRYFAGADPVGERIRIMALRSELEPDAAAAVLREAVWSIDAELPLADIRTMDELLHASLARPRFTTLLLGLFSALALLLACVGIYGVVAYGVAQRTREMGIRVALGAQRGAILALVLRQAMTPVAIGIVAGIGVALLLTRFMGALLHGITPFDPVTFAVVVGLLGNAALLAAWVPARRAVRVDPLESLRAD
jgi:putative ABC transport system permease protein